MKDQKYLFYKRNKDDVIFWVDDVETIGEMLFTFDRKKVFNLFADYPHRLTEEERRIFDQENPYWCDFFKDRNICVDRLHLLIKEYNKGREDTSVGDLIFYAANYIDEAVKIMTQVIQEGRELIAVYPGLDQKPEPGMTHVGPIPDGDLYIK